MMADEEDEYRTYPGPVVPMDEASLAALTAAGTFHKYKTIKDLVAYQAKVKKDKALAVLENEWATKYVQTLINFMCYPSVLKQYTGAEDRKLTVWYTRASDETNEYDGVIPSKTRTAKSTRHEMLHVADSHWIARVPGNTQWFDPYGESLGRERYAWQLPSTNQFCQTYSHIYATGFCDDKHWGLRKVKLSASAIDTPLSGFYENTKTAVEWIATLLDIASDTPIYGECELAVQGYKANSSFYHGALNVATFNTVAIGAGFM